MRRLAIGVIEPAGRLGRQAQRTPLPRPGMVLLGLPAQPTCLFAAEAAPAVRAHGRCGGFTLLEILVVVAILAILTGFAILRLRAGGVDEVLDTEIRRLAALTEAGCEQAIIQARTLGLRFTSGGYDFWMAGDGEWMTMRDRRFRAREFPDVVSVTLDVEGHRVSLAREPEAPQVICTGTGELTSFEFSMSAGRASRRLTGLAYGEIQIH